MGKEYYFVMELLENCYTLGDQIEDDSPLEEALAKLIFRDLVQAVDQCHQAGVCHRDLKEANILLDTNNNKVKLNDFGVSAILLGSLTMKNKSFH